MDLHYNGFCRGAANIPGKVVITVVVDRLSKYAHFIALSHPHTAHIVAQAFLDTIIKLHGSPKLTKIGSSPAIFWKDLFNSMDIQLRCSTAYHAESDGQTERVNQCVENYLRCMAMNKPKKWAAWLPLAEYWYNSCFHTSTKFCPFQALYGFPHLWYLKSLSLGLWMRKQMCSFRLKKRCWPSLRITCIKLRIAWRNMLSWAPIERRWYGLP